MKQANTQPVADKARWRSSKTGSLSLGWLAPWVLSLAVFALIMALLSRVRANHVEKYERSVQVASQAARDSITARLRADEEFAKLLAKNLEQGMLNEEQFEDSAGAYVAEHTHLTAIYLVDREHKVLWVAPPDASANKDELLRYLPEHRVAFDQIMTTKRQTYSPPHVGLAGHQCFDLYTPVVSGEHAPGAVVAAYQSRAILRSSLDRSVLQAHQFELLSGGGEIIHKTPAADTLEPSLAVTVALDRPANGMQLRLTPYRSSFWDWQMLALTGTVLALALGTSVGVWMLQRQIRQTKQAEAALQEMNVALETRVEERTSELLSANHRLTEEMREREAAEATAREALDQLAQIGRVSLVGEMAAGLAHELNQPLGAISSFVRGGKRLLNQGDGNGQVGRVREALDGIDQQTDRAVAIIDRLRDFMSKRPPEMRRVDLPTFFGDSLELIEPQRRTLGITVRNEVPDDAPAVRIDRVQVQQVVLNLLMNAFESIVAAAPDERCVTIALGDQAGGQVELIVRDTGGGVDPHIAPTLFEPFVTTKPAGMGMGLAISRTIIEAHGGRLSVVSSAGRGAEFRFSLPLAEVHDVHHRNRPPVSARA